MIRVSQWAEIRHMHMVQQIPKKQVARRLGLDIKTIRRALESSEPPVRISERRSRRLDKYRGGNERPRRPQLVRGVEAAAADGALTTP